MSDRKYASRQYRIGILVLAVLIAVPTASVADNARALQVLGQGLQKMAEDQQRREQQQERLRLQQEQLELQRQKMQAAEKERQQAQQQVKEAEQRALQTEQSTRAEAERVRRVAEITPPDGYAGQLVVHREALRSELKLFPRELASREQWRYLARVAQILVPTYEEAKDIIGRLNNGEPFEVAALRSRDPGSNKKGGDLGWSQRDNFPIEFADAYSRLEVGRYTRTPIKTQFGWHVIRLLERYGEEAFTTNTNLNEFLESSKKDSYETTDTWRKRIGALSQTHRISADLGDYDADQGRFEVRFRGVPMSLPLPPDVARQLAGAKTVDLEGELKVLDANFFELANAKVLLPDGKTHSIVTKACPKTLAELMDVRHYQHPRLASLRKQILDTSVADTLMKARNAGFDRQAAIQATEEQGDRYIEEAQRIAATKNPAIAADLRNVGKLPLNYDCQGPKNEPVCRYIEQTWRAMAAEAMAGAMACR